MYSEGVTQISGLSLAPFSLAVNNFSQALRKSAGIFIHLNWP
ncbi:unknown protein [Cronobacter turicensis z3032]|uniref:Uncharacterized protein n=1 Tax=Cronobacter turicensis (strain DSM 18703 / CCUG 55852 / LMG 23827 / z3032) TaxID=693216 RepID=C9XYT0_CROTZ|nr:unknown protein [Cronobacter turicensis z3032]CCK15099.1 hypothetical protein BN136_1109 [Cronobacter universalis NCTC 9529]